ARPAMADVLIVTTTSPGRAHAVLVTAVSACAFGRTEPASLDASRFRIAAITGIEPAFTGIRPHDTGRGQGRGIQGEQGGQPRPVIRAKSFPCCRSQNGADIARATVPVRARSAKPSAGHAALAGDDNQPTGWDIP